jgi:hypothetical protein
MSSGSTSWQTRIGEVLSLHVFTPAHALGIEDGRNTHSDAFDEPPAQSGSARAAVEATYRLLSAFERGLERPDQAEQLIQATLDPMLQASATGVSVNITPGPEWQAERNRRLALEHSITTPIHAQSTPYGGSSEGLRSVEGVLSGEGVGGDG